MDEVLSKENPESYSIAVLHKAQELWGYLDQEVIDKIAHYMNIPTAHLWGVATFYHYFNLSPQGKHKIFVCLGTACYVKGASAVLEAIKKELSIDVGQTSVDNLFSLQAARCLGACGLAPVVMIDDIMYGAMTPKKIVQILNSYRKKGGDNAK